MSSDMVWTVEDQEKKSIAIRLRFISTRLKQTMICLDPHHPFRQRGKSCSTKLQNPWNFSLIILYRIVSYQRKFHKFHFSTMENIWICDLYKFPFKKHSNLYQKIQNGPKRMNWILKKKSFQRKAFSSVDDFNFFRSNE